MSSIVRTLYLACVRACTLRIKKKDKQKEKKGKGKEKKGGKKNNSQVPIIQGRDHLRLVLPVLLPGCRCGAASTSQMPFS